MTLFQAFPPIAQIHYSQCGAQVASTVIPAMHTRLVYSVRTVHKFICMCVEALAKRTITCIAYKFISVVCLKIKKFVNYKNITRKN